MGARVRIGAVALLALAAAACSPVLREPKLSPLTADEKTMDCAQLDLALDRADTVRWLIRENGVRLETRAMRTAAYFIAAPFIMPLLPFVEDREFAAPLDAADRRIRQLLQQKRSRDCRPRATAIADMDDAALLRALESLQSKLDAGGDEAALLDERTRLLDNLRVVPPPAVPKEPR